MQHISLLILVIQILLQQIDGAAAQNFCETPQWLSPVEHVNIKTRENEEIVIQCDDWYELQAGASTWICQDGGNWVKSGEVINPNPPEDRPLCVPVCGIKGGPDRPLLSVHVAGGKNAAKNEWPWLIFLSGGRDSEIDSAHMICGGSLISPNFVLTAAHCVADENYPGGSIWANHTHVWLGVHDRREANSEKVKYVLAEEVILHPEYHKASTWDFDVALIKLSDTITMTGRYRPVCLPLTNEDFDVVKPGVSGEVAGWGLFGGPQAAYKVLHAEFPVVGDEECLREFSVASKRENLELPPRMKITQNMFCAGLPAGRRSTCEGDSGGPFVIKKSDTDIYYAVGLVSFGVGGICGKSFSYTGYTRINEDIVKWIRDTTDNLR